VTKASVLKPVFSTIEQGLVLRVMGQLSAADLRTLQGLLRQVIGRANRSPVPAGLGVQTGSLHMAIPQSATLRPHDGTLRPHRDGWPPPLLLRLVAQK
jgi:hypothetical protein